MKVLISLFFLSMALHNSIYACDIVRDIAEKPELKKSIQWIEDRVNQETGLVKSFEGLPSDDSSKGVTWIYNQAQTLKLLVLCKNEKLASLIVNSSLNLPQEKGVWYNAYLTAHGTISKKHPSHAHKTIGPNMAMAHSLLDYYYFTKNLRQKHKILENFRQQINWLKSIFHSNQTYGYVLGKKAHGEISVEYNARVFSFLKRLSLLEREFNSSEKKFLSHSSHLIQKWILEEAWNGQYYEPRIPETFIHKLKFLIFPSGTHISTSYTQYIIPIMAFDAGLSPKNYNQGLQWLWDKEKALYIPRKMHDDSFWGKGTAEFAKALALSGEINKAKTLMKSLDTITNENGSVLATKGKTQGKWPYDYRYPSIEATVPMILAWVSISQENRIK